MTLDMIAFDADDTLWHNETLYHQTQDKYKRLVDKYIPTQDLDEKLYQTEIKNLPYFGYGIKSFTLSMIENACRLTDGCISVEDVLQIIQFAREMRDAPVELLPGVQDVITRLSQEFDLMIITKGDLLDQQSKLNRSGLGTYFKSVEVVIDKTPEIYARLVEAHHIDVRRFIMVGNSLRSDILPAVALGAHAVYIPYHLTWAHEHDIEHFSEKSGYYEIEHISLLPELIGRLQLKWGILNNGE
jgi:putative hydrolase of the HAD superfamily